MTIHGKVHNNFDNEDGKAIRALPGSQLCARRALVPGLSFAIVHLLTSWGILRLFAAGRKTVFPLILVEALTVASQTCYRSSMPTSTASSAGT